MGRFFEAVGKLASILGCSHRRWASPSSRFAAGPHGRRSLRCEPLELRTLLSLGSCALDPPWPQWLADDPVAWFNDESSRLWVEFLPGAAPAAPPAALTPPTFSLEYTDQGIRGRVWLPGVEFHAVSAAGTQFARLSVPGWSSGGRPGEPELPVFRTSLIVPAGMEVTAECAIENAARLGTTRLIYPAQPPLPDTAYPYATDADTSDLGASATIGASAAATTGTAEFAYNEDYYAGTTASPRELLKVGEPAIARDNGVVLLEVSPFQYDPGTGEIAVAVELEFSVAYVGVGPTPRSVDGVESSPPASDDGGKSGPVVSDEAAEADYLIITADEFYDDVLRLAEWKQLKGIRTHVAQLSDIGSSTSSVRSFIRDVYETGTKTSYVLLVGDYDDVPSNYVSGYYISDHPYACIEGGDYLPDLTLGRLPVNTEAQAADVIDKILTYDRTPDMGDWYDDVLVAGFFQDQDDPGPDGYADRWFMETSMHVGDYLRDERGMTVHTALCADEGGGPPYYYRTADYPHRLSVSGAPPYPVPPEVVALWTSAEQARGDVSAAINAGVGLVQHRDHGSETGWGDPPFRNADVNDLSNGVKTPVVLSINCSTGTFDYYGGDSFAEALLKHPNGGAVGVLAATNTSYSGFNDLLVHGLYTSFWPDYDPTCTDAAYPRSMRPAEALSFAKYYMLVHGGANPYSQLEFNEYLWFGDPEMMLRTETPAVLSVDHPRAIQLDAPTDLTVTVTTAGTAVAGARVCISLPGTDDYWVGTTDAVGRATFAAMAPGSIGLYRIVVTACNAAPYEGTINGVTRGPFGELVWPAAGSAIDADPGYLDVEWLDFFAAGLDTSTIDAGDVSIAGVTVQTPTHQGGNVWRYPYSGTLTPGVIEVVVHADQVRDDLGDWNAGQTLRFTYDVEGPGGRLHVPAADSEIHDDLGYLDILFTDVGQAGVDVATLDAGDLAVAGLTFNEPPVDHGGGVWRYYYTGALAPGQVTVEFVAGAVWDRAGNPNPGHTETFTFAPLTITSLTVLPQAAFQEPYRFTLHAQGGVPPYEWSPALPVVITECGLGGPDYVEIQNTSGQSVDTEGWVLAVSDDYTDINAVNAALWQLPTSIEGGQVLYRTDRSDDNPFGGNILWNAGNAGWAALIDNNGNLVDFLAWHWMQTNLAAMDLEINGQQILVGDAFSGDGVVSRGLGTIQRQGSADRNTAADFTWVDPPSKGGQNTGLVVPFVGGGAMPEGLSIDRSTGIVTGSPTEIGSFDFAVRAMDSASPAHAVTKEFCLEVVVLPPLTVNLPTDVAEGGGAVPASVSIPEALASDLSVSFQSDDPSELTVPDTVTIPAGRTTADFEITVIDDGELDWIRQVVISASAADYASRYLPLSVHDNETTSLTVDLPSSAAEGAGVLVGQGRVTAHDAPTCDVVVELSCDDLTEATVPATVTILAGRNSATFDVTVLDDAEIDGAQTATVTARVENWTDGSDSIDVIDDDNDLFVTLPAAAWEGDGVLSGAGMVRISGTLPTDLVVSLGSDAPAQLDVPASATIPAGQTWAAFDLYVVDDVDYDGRQTAAVTAHAAGFRDGDDTITVGDNDVHHFSILPVSTPQTASMPFGVAIEAKDVDEETIRVFGETVNLLARGGGNTTSTIVISEVSVSSPDRVEFTNVSGVAIDLSQWQVVLYDRASQTSPLSVFAIPADTMCPAGDVFLVCQKGVAPGTYPSFYTGDEISWREDESAGVLLLDAAGRVVDFMAAAALNPAQISDPLNIVPDHWQGGQVPALASDAVSYQRIGIEDHDTADDWTARNPTLGIVNPGLTLPFVDGATPLPVSPATTTAFVQGAWFGPVSVDAVHDDVVLVVDDGSGHVGTSNTFDVLAGPLDHFGFGPIASPQYVGLPFAITLTALDAHGHAVGDFGGTVWLSGWAGAEPGVPVGVSPAVTAAFDQGIWVGEVAIFEATTAMHLQADDHAGHPGASTVFDVESVIPLTVTVPGDATEGDGAVYGSVTIPFALATDLTISLRSDDSTEATVPATTVILAGQTEVPFELTIVDDAELDWIRPVAISASAPGYGGRPGVIAVHDNETATLTVALPAEAAEGDGLLAGCGTVTVDRAPTCSVVVAMSSADPTEAIVPPSVTILAGRTSASFDITVLDDTRIDGPQGVAIVARVENWTDGAGSIVVGDNESRDLLVTLPALAWEGDGRLTDAATLHISGTLPADLVVSLVSDNVAEVNVPETVTIPAGAMSATFDVTVVDDAACDGARTVTITAAADGFLNGDDTMRVADDDVHHFTFDPVGTRQLASEPFPVTIRARDVGGEEILVYVGTVDLGANSHGGLPVEPATTGAFAAGVWTGEVTVHATGADVELTAGDGWGHVGISDPFDLVAGPLDCFAISPFDSPQYVGLPFALTLTAQDAHGYVVTDFIDRVNLTGWIGTGTGSTVVVSEVNTLSDAVEFTNVSGTNLDISGWQVLIYHHAAMEVIHVFTVPETTICSAGDVFTINERGLPPGSYPSFYSGANIVWTTTSATGVLLLDADGQVVDFMAASGLDPAIVTDPVPVVPQHWQGSQVPRQPSYSYSYQRIGDSDTDGAGDWVCDNPSLGIVNAGLTVPFLGDAVAVEAMPFMTPAFVGGVWSGPVTVFREATDVYLRVDDGSGHVCRSDTFDVRAPVDLNVVGHHVFYNHSAFDGNDPAPNARDDDAIASDKQALLPGQTATFANYTSFQRGINGIMVDIGGPVASLSVDDFRFRVGNDADPDGWNAAETPQSITVRPGAGEGGSDRVTILWNDHAIAGQWLEVTVFATENTRLAQDDVFYFGNAIGEAGNSTSDAKVNAVDMLLARNNPRTFLDPARIDMPYDFNRDARVNASDMLLARNSQTNFLTALQLIDLSRSSPSAAETEPGAVALRLDTPGQDRGDKGQEGSRQNGTSEGLVGSQAGVASGAWIYVWDRDLPGGRPAGARIRAQSGVDAAICGFLSDDDRPG
ncbi:MAG: lamin tail domain-containing protein [Pirellulales bacterium]|nr:lamin tail domain-containing protein [Pirellulales bacterium]